MSDMNQDVRELMIRACGLELVLSHELGPTVYVAVETEDERRIYEQALREQAAGHLADGFDGFDDDHNCECVEPTPEAGNALYCAECHGLIVETIND